ncbi:MAG: 4Fe-4S binding protein [Eggerthellaceae bacterium]|nr:4Fe-4S binding protein [Eggerthellaceae bacterium]
MCIGCGTCATACPTCALEAHCPNDAELLSRCDEALRLGDGAVGISCSEFLTSKPATATKPLVEVTCLSRVGENTLVELAARGAQDIVLLHGECSRCEHGSCFGVSSEVFESACVLLAAWGCATRLHMESEVPECLLAQSPNPSTGLPGASFVSMRGDAALGRTSPAPHDATPTACVRVMPDGTLPHFLPERHERLLDSLATLGQPIERVIRTRLWGRVSIDASICSSCRLCSVFCPTGALSRFSDGDGSFGLEHCPGDCVQCRSCEAVCRHGALTVSDEVLTAELMDGAVERIAMKKPEIDHNSAESMMQKLQKNCRAVLSDKR